jgi:aspartyl/asparaginyl beta-hydroxylase (cupin superfamily)
MRSGDTRAAAMLLERVVALGNASADELLRVAVTRRALGDVTGALDAVTEALRLRPDHFLALLMGGSLLSRLGRREEAGNAYRAAIRIAPPMHQLPPALRRELDNGRALITAEQAWRDAIRHRSIDGLAEASPAEQARIEAFREALAERAVGYVYPGLEPLGFVDPYRFEGMAALEAGAAQVREEFLALAETQSPALYSQLQHAGAETTETGKETGRWSVMQLIADGEPVEANARACPETMRLCETLGMPAIAGRSPNLLFSILDPHTRIPAHRGVTNTRLVLHLPLVVPEDCAIRVGEETRRWTPGKAMVFDDTVEHEAWNDSDEIRVVLLGDLWRPELAPVERGAIVALAAR